MSRLFSQSSVSDSPAGGSPGGLGLEKGTRRRGLELWPGPSSSLLSGLEGPLDRLSPHGPPGRHRPLVPAPAWPGPKADTSPGCSGSVGNREQASERAGGAGGEQRDGEGRGPEQARERGVSQLFPLSVPTLEWTEDSREQAQVFSRHWLPKRGQWQREAGLPGTPGPSAPVPGPHTLLWPVSSPLITSSQSPPRASPVRRTNEAWARRP